ncbi:MAG: DUF6036 family nucleotidyltransferase [Chthoniobacterales bacterium]
MRTTADSTKVQLFIDAMGARLKTASKIYLVGGSTAVLHGWRSSTIDIDILAEPDSDGFFEAVAELKESLDVNVELVSPSHFLPELPGWRERSDWIASVGKTHFYHYDYYSQVLSKMDRAHPRDIRDVEAFLSRGLVSHARLCGLFSEIEHLLIRFPAVDAASLRSKVLAWPDQQTRSTS